MHIAQFFHVVDRLSLADELLLGAHDVVGGNILKATDEIGAHALQRLALVQTREKFA